MIRPLLIAALMALAAAPSGARAGDVSPAVEPAELADLERQRVECRKARDWLCVFDRTQALYRASFERFANAEADPEGRQLLMHIGIGTELALETTDTDTKLHLTSELFWLLVRRDGRKWRRECFLVCIARAEALATAGDLDGGAEFARVALSHSDRLKAYDWIYPSVIYRGEMDAVIILREDAARRLSALETAYEGRL